MTVYIFQKNVRCLGAAGGTACKYKQLEKFRVGCSMSDSSHMEPLCWTWTFIYCISSTHTHSLFRL